MSFFCLLWVPLFLMLRRSLLNEEGGNVLALLFGSVTAIAQFLMGNLVNPGGFGFSRWVYGFVDIVSVPVLFPLLIYAVSLIISRSQNPNFTSFTLLWLIPVGALRALSWSAGRDPILLVAVPLLWTALAVGIPYFIHLIIENYNAGIRIAFILCILALPALGALSYWAFFTQQVILGFVFIILTHVPMVLSFVLKR